MQFDYQRKVGQNFVKVEFKSAQNAKTWYSLSDSFERIGGKCTDLLKDWTFPVFVSPRIIQEIINNTCFVCGGLMKDSIKVRKCTQCGHSHT